MLAPNSLHSLLLVIHIGSMHAYTHSGALPMARPRLSARAHSHMDDVLKWAADVNRWLITADPESTAGWPATSPLATALGIANVCVYGVLTYKLFPFLTKGQSPFVATDPQKLEALFGEDGCLRSQGGVLAEDAPPVAQQHLVDLGSGDGSVVRAATRFGGYGRATGHEIDSGLIRASRSESAGRDNENFEEGSLWDASLSDADVVVIYMLPNVLEALADKIAREMRQDAVVVSNRFPLPETPNLTLVREVPVETPLLSPDVSSSLWCYRVDRGASTPSTSVTAAAATRSLSRLRGGFTSLATTNRAASSLARSRHQIGRRAQPQLVAAGTASIPDHLDTALAAAGAGLGVATLTLLQHWLPLKMWTAGLLHGVYVTTLCSSAIILNYADAPPNFFTVFWATFMPAAVTVALMKLTRSSAIVRPISVMFTMAWFKLAGCAFPPAAALANTFLDNPTCAPMGWAYVTLPCTGNAILWLIAAAFSRIRQRVKRQGLDT